MLMYTPQLEALKEKAISYIIEKLDVAFNIPIEGISVFMDNNGEEQRNSIKEIYKLKEEYWATMKGYDNESEDFMLLEEFDVSTLGAIADYIFTKPLRNLGGIPSPFSMSDGKMSFYKDGQGWFIDLPQYIEGGGTKGDLAMVAGADTMLDYIIENQGLENDSRVSLHCSLSREAEKIDYVLTKKEEVSDTGGCYYYWGKPFSSSRRELWLCAVARWVFGYYPDNLYLKILETHGYEYKTTETAGSL